MDVIEITALRKSYGDLEVLRGLDLRVPQGIVYGLLGPNGSGKTTLLHVLLGFLKPNSGTVAVLGHTNLRANGGRIGYLPERLRYHLRFSAREYLRDLAALSGVPGRMRHARVDEELRRVGLLGAADRLLGTYSKGMLQRFGIAQALLADPELLLIDEPTSGLDPAGQHEMLALLDELRQRGHSILLCTHYLDEVERLCDQVGILNGGKLAVELEVARLRVPGLNVVIATGAIDAELNARLRLISPAVQVAGREVRIQPNTPALQATVLRMLLDADVPVVALRPQGRPLEAIYMQVARGEQPDLAILDAARTGADSDRLLNELLGK